MSKIINLTPHTVKIIGENGEVVAEYPSTGNARVNSNFSEVGKVDGFPILKTTYGETDGLPNPDGETTYIVSMVVAMANPHRSDIVSPNTAPQAVVRDASGAVFGVRSFSRY
ncbi:MAG TPA: hypothetical protein PKE69_27505 [Pyrinomonadaceae bacterium]|nr:hypothetical protein [Pyrinomonadaceae bacterium]